MLPLWVAACLLKAASRGWWTLAALLAVAFVLPVASATGSPTYTVFALMLSTATAALGDQDLERRLGFIEGWPAVAVAVAAAMLAVALRGGVDVPVVSKLARPLLAESERTHQLETLVDRLLHSPLRDRPLRLYRDANSPMLADNSVDRTHRPPTQELFFEHYVRLRRGHEALPGDTLWIAFGGDRVPGGRPVELLRGRFAGEAAAFAR